MTMETIKNWMKSPMIFVLLYLGCMVPTYVIPYFRSTIGAIGIIAGSGSIFAGATGLFGFQLLLTALLVLFAYVRGSLTGKGWLMAFPIVALVFDFAPVLSLIPFVPTVMHILALVLGVQGSVVADGQ